MLLLKAQNFKTQPKRVCFCKFSEELYFLVATFEVNRIIFLVSEAPTEGVLWKTDVLKIFAKFTGKHIYWSLFSTIQHRCFPVKFAKFLKISILGTSTNDCFYSFLSNWVIYFLLMLYILLYSKDIVFVNDKQNISILFKLNPQCDKKKALVKKSFDEFLLHLCNRFFLVLEVLYKRNCSAKGAVHRLTY